MVVKMSDLYDVIGVNMETHRVRIMAAEICAKMAERIEGVCVMNHGVDKEFFTTVEGGAYSEGDEWRAGDDL